MAKWDLTTAEGREAFERFVMARMGWQRTTLLSLPGWQHEKTGRVVADGWIYTGDGMVELKRWAAEKKGIVISSEFHPDGAGRKAQGIARCWELVSGKELALERADIEEDAVALALARALEEMEGSK